MLHSALHFSAAFFPEALLKNWWISGWCATIGTCYWSCLHHDNLNIFIYFTIQLLPKKLVRAILGTHTCPNPTLDARERLSAVGRQTKEPDLNPLKLSKIIFPVYFFSVSKTVSSSRDLTNFCLPHNNCRTKMITTHLPKKWSV